MPAATSRNPSDVGNTDKSVSAGHDTHVLFQYLLAARFASEATMEALHERVKSRCQHKVQDSVTSAMTQLNARLDGIGFRIRKERHLATDEIVWVLINTMSDAISQAPQTLTWASWQKASFREIGQAFQAQQHDDGTYAELPSSDVLSIVQKHRKVPEDVYRFIASLVQDGWLAEVLQSGASNAFLPGPVFTAELGGADFTARASGPGASASSPTPADSPAAAADAGSSDGDDDDDSSDAAEDVKVKATKTRAAKVGQKRGRGARE